MDNVQTTHMPETQHETVAAQDERVIEQNKIVHQVIVLSLLHIFYLLIEGFNQFEQQWISSVIYSILAAGTIVFLWIQRKNSKYLMAIPFISLIIVGALLEETITTTVIFAVYCLYFFIYQFFIKSEIDTILTVVMSGITMVTLIAFTLFDHGFVKINHELNVILGIWFVWCLTTLGLAFIHRRNQTLHFTFLIIVILLSAIGPFFGFILVYDNVFAIICGIQIFIALAISMLTVFLDEELIVKKFLGYIGINLVAIIIYSFSFRLSFDWLNNVNKSYVVDYTLLIPLVLITTIVLTQKFYQESKSGKGISPSHYHENQQIVKNDTLFFVTFIILLSSSVLTHLQNFSNFEYLLLKGLIISIIFVATTIPLNIRYSTILSLISTMVFLVTVLLYLGGVSNYAAFITLLAIVGVVLVFAIINDLFLIGEPLTTNLSIVGMLVGMIASIIFFYIENMLLKEIWTSITWAILGMFQFASGIMFNRIFLRRTGLMIILFDIVYSLIAISIQYRGWQMGVAFIVLALVLLLCIYLLRWSEKKEKEESELEVTA